MTAWEALWGASKEIRTHYHDNPPINPGVVSLMEYPALRTATYNRRRRLGSAPWHPRWESGTSRVNQRITAFLVQIAGQEVNPCTKCDRGLGMWEGCVIHPEQAVGTESGRLACANCAVNGQVGGYQFPIDSESDTEYTQTSDEDVQEEPAPVPQTQPPVPALPVPSREAEAVSEHREVVAISSDSDFSFMADDDSPSPSPASPAHLPARSISPSPGYLADLEVDHGVEDSAMDLAGEEPSLPPSPASPALSSAKSTSPPPGYLMHTEVDHGRGDNDMGLADEEERSEEASPRNTRPVESTRSVDPRRNRYPGLEARIAAARDRRRARGVAKSDILSEGDISDVSSQPLDRQEMFGRDPQRVQAFLGPPPRTFPPPSQLERYETRNARARARRAAQAAPRETLFRYRPY